MEKKKILLVDDDASITDLVKAYLEQTGKYEVNAENSPAQALNTAKAFKPDLVVLDVDMPEMDGPEVAEALRSDTITRNVPIVFLTSIVSESETEAHGGVIGGHPFIAKPVSRQKLVDFIEQVISKPNSQK